MISLLLFIARHQVCPANIFNISFYLLTLSYLVKAVHIKLWKLFNFLESFVRLWREYLTPCNDLTRSSGTIHGFRWERSDIHRIPSTKCNWEASELLSCCCKFFTCSSQNTDDQFLAYCCECKTIGQKRISEQQLVEVRGFESTNNYMLRIQRSLTQLGKFSLYSFTFYFWYEHNASKPFLSSVIGWPRFDHQVRTEYYPFSADANWHHPARDRQGCVIPRSHH